MYSSYWPEFGREYYEVMDGELGRSEGITPTGQEQWLFDSVYVINVQGHIDFHSTVLALVYCIPVVHMIEPSNGRREIHDAVPVLSLRYTYPFV